MEVGVEHVSYVRLAVVLGAICILLILASVLLVDAVGFGFTAGEMAANPSAAPDANAQLKRAENLSLTLVAVVLMVLATVVVQAGVLKRELHWAARAGGAFVVGAILSYLIVVAMLTTGGLPHPLDELGGALAKWIQQHV